MPHDSCVIWDEILYSCCAILNRMSYLCCVILNRMSHACCVIWHNVICLMCDLALEDALCVVELMELTKYVETTSYDYNLTKECGKR